MRFIESFENWADDCLLNYTWTVKGKVVEVSGLGTCIIVEPNRHDRLFDKDMLLHLTEEHVDLCKKTKADNWIFEFGGNWYSTDVESETVQFNPVEDVGEAYSEIDHSNYAFLGVHGKYEAMSGTREYSDWCKRAKFLNIKSLGICERGTLAGTLPFQLACSKAGIKAVIGYTARIEDQAGEVYEVKVYVKNDAGWRTLLNYHNRANVETGGLIDEGAFVGGDLSGLVIVLPPNKHTYSKRELYEDACENLYWQFTSNEYKSEAADLDVLKSMKNFMSTDIPAVLISDAFVLNRRDTHIRRKLLTISGNRVPDRMEDYHGYFKSIDDQFMDVEDNFPQDSEYFLQFFNNAIKATKEIEDLCEFNIDTKTLYLPKYEMTRGERRQYGDCETMFDQLVEEGKQRYLDRELLKDPMVAESPLDEELDERIEKEVDVIKRGGFVDYFLILWDIIQWCDTQKIQVGPGRGSAAGSLVSYLLGIVKIDPLEYDLLFERFLNESRIKSSMPDIDIDFASDRRDEVIEYMKERYGKNYVCRVGTYGTLQMRGLFGDLNRYYGALPTKDLQYLSKMIDEDNTNWGALFVDGVKKMKLKGFIKKNPELVNDCRLALGSIKSSSMHACATIIFPKLKGENGEKLDIYSQVPIRLEDETLVSEWEGGIMEKAGFLKEDILSTKQMAKFGHMFDMIEERYGKRIRIEDIPFDDKNVLKLFQKGMNQDVFHFGSEGLTNYLTQVQPQTFEELIASIALYRPGAIMSKAHEAYVKLKNGERQPEYDYMLQGVTEETYGLYIYQEQIMKAAQVLGSFSLVDADGIRKAMGKKIKDLMDGYKVQFIENAQKNGCPQQEAEEIWDKMEVFSGYGFNKSHAAAYSAIGYQCNWLKYHYPLEFWTVAFDVSDEKHIPAFLAEIHKQERVKVAPPDINESQVHFYSDPNNNTIYWSIEKIAYVGEVATRHILDVRNEGGKFYSLEEFLDRVQKRIVNKKVATNLILAGAFDEMYDIKAPSERLKIIEELYELREEDLPEEYKTETVKHDYYWSMQQMDVAKLGDMNYPKLVHTLSEFQNVSTGLYVEPEEFHSSERIDDDVIIAGIVHQIEEKNATNGKFATIQLMNGDHLMTVRIWGQVWENQKNDDRFANMRNDLLDAENRILVIKGKIEGPNKYHANNMMYVQPYRTGSVYQIF